MDSLGEIAVVGGVAVTLLGVIFNYFKINKIAKENEYKNVINSQRADLNLLKKDLEKITNKSDEFKNIIKELEIALVRSNALSIEFPFPFWYKSNDGIMRMVNEEYCKVYKRCREDYIGKTDFQVWDEDSAKKFQESDLIALESSEGFYISEKQESERLIIKWVVPGLTKDESYIAGISIPFKTKQ